MAAHTKLMGTKQLLLISCAMALGLVLAGYRLHAEHGQLAKHHLISITLSAIVCLVILVAVTRIANRDSEK
jgi:hypothetical protein